MKGLKILFKIILALVVLFAVFLVILTLGEYKPKKEEVLVVENPNTKKMPKEFTLTLWNIGYAGLSEKEDFFMDGGKKGRPDNKELVQENLAGIQNLLQENHTDFVILQEVDENSRRSYYMNQKKLIQSNFSEYTASYGYNYRCLYVPVPFPPMGKVNSGLLSLSRYEIEKSIRHQFVGNYAWPVSLFQLKRCFVENYIPIEGSDKYLVLINTHNSAYDKGGFLRKQQLSQLREVLLTHYEQGHYVLVAGDWNHGLPGVPADLFPSVQAVPDWRISFPENWMPEGWTWAYDKSTPTIRTVDVPYEKGFNYINIIDGVLCSPNISVVEAKTFDEEFRYSDHNPSRYTFKLK